jgi:hypothetical protein
MFTIKPFLSHEITECLFWAFFFFFLVVQGLNSGLRACKADALLPETHHLSFLLWLFWRWDVVNYLPGLTSNCNPPYLSLSSS